MIWVLQCLTIVIETFDKQIRLDHNKICKNNKRTINIFIPVDDKIFSRINFKVLEKTRITCAFFQFTYKSSLENVYFCQLLSPFERLVTYK